LNSTNISSIVLRNQFPSNPYSEEESVNEIRKNAPKSFSYQQRLVTANDFQTFILDNYYNVFSDCQVVSNDDYLKGHVKYLYDIGIKSPQLDNAILYNQIKFSNSCNFNNIYAYVVPLNGSQQYATPAQKELFLNDIKDQKIITSEVVPMDPIYMLFDFYINSPNGSTNINDIDQNTLLIYKTSNTRQSDTGIINNVIKLITNTFSKSNVKLGQFIDISQLASNISNLEGVEKIQTFRSDTKTYVDGLSLICWNSTYPNLDVTVRNHNFQLQYFQYPVFNNVSNLINKIKVVDSTGVITLTDY
jgi:hypothetical protein